MDILKIGRIKNVFLLKKIVNIKDVKLLWIKTLVIYVKIIINSILKLDYVLKEMLILITHKEIKLEKLYLHFIEYKIIKLI